MFESHIHGPHRHFHPSEEFPGNCRRDPSLFRRGDMKYIVLALLKEKPAHGYELTLAMEERFHGLRSLSAGSVYPVLQLLEDMGYVTCSASEGKKTYTITASGEKFLEDQKETVDSIKQRVWGSWGSENKEHLREARSALNYVRELNHYVRHYAVRGDPSMIGKVNEVLARALKDIEGLYGERQASEPDE